MRRPSVGRGNGSIMRRRRSERAGEALPDGAVRRRVERHRGGETTHRLDAVAEEVPIAFVYNGRPHAVMLATPADLEDFALGFSLSEAIVGAPAECEKVEIAPTLGGIELRIAVPAARAASLAARVRQLTGRTGCGLCGAQALDALAARQTINVATGATHAAAWATPDGAVALVREDVGRHNALDKLIGAMARARVDPRRGFLLVTSRASYEMVMKAATVGIGILAAISAPTALAIALAAEANLTLIAFARPQGHSIYTHAARIHGAPRQGATA